MDRGVLVNLKEAFRDVGVRWIKEFMDMKDEIYKAGRPMLELRRFQIDKSLWELVHMAQMMGIDPRLLVKSKGDLKDFWKEVKLKGPHRRVIRNYPKICTFSKKFFVNKRVVKIWPKKNVVITTTKGKLPDLIKELLPFKPNKYCKYVGDIDIPFGAGKIKVVKPDTKVLEYLREKRDQGLLNEFEEFLLNQPARCIVNPSWGAIEGEFEGMCSPPVEGYKTDVQTLINTVINNADKLLLPYVNQYNPENILDLETNPTSFTGLIGSKLFGHSHKIADPIGKPIAVRAAKEVTSRLSFDKSIYVASPVRPRHRDFDDDVELKGRLGLMPEYIPKMIGSSVANPIMEGIVEINKTTPDNEIKLGLDFMHRNHHFFTYKNLDAFYFVEADFTRFDQHIMPEFMLVALAILRCCYNASDRRIDRLFHYIASGFVYKNVLIPGRFVYRLIKGLPSGSPFTSLVGTLVSWLAWSTVFGYIGIIKRRLYCYGDDFLAKIYQKIGRTQFESLQGLILNVSNLKMDPPRLLANDDFTEIDYSDRPSLLKTVDLNGFPVRRWKDWVDTLVYGRKETDYVDLSYRITGLMYAPPFDHLVTRTLVNLRSWCRRKALEKHNQAYGSCGKLWDSVEGAERSAKIAQSVFLMQKTTKFDVSKMGLWWMDGYERIIALDNLERQDLIPEIAEYFITPSMRDPPIVDWTESQESYYQKFEQVYLNLNNDFKD